MIQTQSDKHDGKNIQKSIPYGSILIVDPCDPIFLVCAPSGALIVVVGHVCASLGLVGVIVGSSLGGVVVVDASVGTNLGVFVLVIVVVVILIALLVVVFGFKDLAAYGVAVFVAEGLEAPKPEEKVPYIDDYEDC